MPAPRVIYQPGPDSPIDVDRAFYGRLGRETESRSLIEQFVVPIRSGKAWPVMAGQICRIVVVEGAQVADFNAWNLNNPRERFWAARTKQLHRAHVTTFDRLWSCPPISATNAYHHRRHGGTIPWTRTAPDVTTCWARAAIHTFTKLLNGEDFDYCCHSNLVRAVAPFHLGRERRPRRPQHIPGDRSYPGRPLLREAFARQAGGLL